MNASLHRRVDVSSLWATTRIAFLDSLERYEDSYAITQEFREWITCVGDHPEHLEDSVLMVPASLDQLFIERRADTDEVIGI